MKTRPPHVIRLREPWELSGSADGRLVLARRFQQPTGLQSDDRVELVVAGLEGVLRIVCNGHELRVESDAAGELRGEIRHLLLDRNQVAIILEAAPAAASELESSLRQSVLAAGLVRLEIQAPPF
jgi:hypothetical protein